MNNLLPITVAIITRNESARIADAILSVKPFASEVIVVDSKSTDDTVAKAESLGAKVVVNEFKGFGQQKNLAHALANQEWVLNLDADERMSPELIQEIRTHFQGTGLNAIDGFYLPRKTWYLNRWIMHGGWYPNYLLRLARKNKSHWSEPKLHEALKVIGKTENLLQPLLHYSFPNQRSHTLKNIEYAEHAKNALLQRGKTVRTIDFLKPFWKFFDIYILKAGFLDGAPGFFIAIHSAYALFLRYTYLYEETTQNTRSR